MTSEPIDNFELISTARASVLTENWQKENFIKAFLFHKNDIACLAQQRDVVGVRFYIGIIKNEDGSDEPDMIVVGVNSDNEDIIYDDTVTESELVISGIYDFALPCPKLCDPKSPLFNSNSDTAPANARGTMKTIQHSTEDDCVINLGTISVQDAIDRVSIWQCEMNKELISIYFNIENLDSLFRYFASANALRVYFGLENNEHRVVLIGASNDEEAYFSDVDTEFVYVNTVAPCTDNGEHSCAVNRTLNRNCNQS